MHSPVPGHPGVVFIPVGSYGATERPAGCLTGNRGRDILGAGLAYLLMTAPADLEEDDESEPLTGSELLSLTGTAAVFLRKLDDIRRKT